MGPEILQLTGPNRALIVPEKSGTPGVPHGQVTIKNDAISGLGMRAFCAARRG
jgi:hypothetical protein